MERFMVWKHSRWEGEKPLKNLPIQIQGKRGVYLGLEEEEDGKWLLISLGVMKTYVLELNSSDSKLIQPYEYAKYIKPAIIKTIELYT